MCFLWKTKGTQKSGLGMHQNHHLQSKPIKTSNHRVLVATAEAAACKYNTWISINIALNFTAFRFLLIFIATY